MTYDALLFVCRAIILAVFAVVFVRQNLPALRLLPVPVPAAGRKKAVAPPQTFSVVLNDGRYFRMRMEGKKCFLLIFPPDLPTDRLKKTDDGRYYLPSVRSEAQARAWLARLDASSQDAIRGA